MCVCVCVRCECVHVFSVIIKQQDTGWFLGRGKINIYMYKACAATRPRAVDKSDHLVVTFFEPNKLKIMIMIILKLMSATHASVVAIFGAGITKLTSVLFSYLFKILVTFIIIETI